MVDLEDGSKDAVALLEEEERAQLLRVAAASLSPIEQEAIYLRYCLGLRWSGSPTTPTLSSPAISAAIETANPGCP